MLNSLKSIYLKIVRENLCQQNEPNASRCSLQSFSVSSPILPKSQVRSVCGMNIVYSWEAMIGHDDRWPGLWAP